MENAKPNPVLKRHSGWYWVAASVVVLIVVAVPVLPIGINSYTVRSQVSEGSSLAEGAKIAIRDFYEAHKALPANNREAGLPQPRSITGDYVTSVAVVSGDVVVSYGALADAGIAGKVLVFRPHPVSGYLDWDCTTKAGTTVPVGQRPTACRP